MKQTALRFSAVLVACALVWGCSKSDPSKKAEVVTVMAHDSFQISEELIRGFEKESGLIIRFIKSGDAGVALNQAILSRKNPMADVFFGVDNTFMSRALKEDIFEAYASPMLSSIDDGLRLDKTNRLLPVDFGDVCLNYDRAWFGKAGIKPPERLEDLVRPEYANLLVVESPVTSSPGMAFLLATVGHFGPENYLAFWEGLRKNGVLVTDGWEDAYWGRFSAASKGTRPIVVSYAGSPAAEVYYAKTPPAEAPTAAVTGDGTAFRQIEFVGILKGAKNSAAARKVVDFMLSKPFQEDIPLKMFVFPANRHARLPDVFVRHARSADKPVSMPPETISEHRDAWAEDWARTVLQ